MSSNEKETLLTSLKKELYELETERKFMQRQTGHHVQRELRDKYESEVLSLRKRIEELEDTLSSE